MKLINMKSNTFYLGLCLFFFSFYCVLYSNYILKDPVLTRDDVLFIYPLNATSTFSEYVEAVKNNSIPDFQPIRDFTFFLNLKIFDWTKISTFHSTNLILFLCTIFLLMKLLEALGFYRKQIIFSALLYAVHPIMVSSIGWISSRKHTLALVFILLMLLDFIKKKKITNLSILYYVLSILSHQIFILVPVWIFIYERVHKFKTDFWRITVMSTLGLSVLITGILKTFYLEMGNVTYKYYDLSENLSRYALSLGRSFVQIFFPVSISSDYYQGSMLNIVGIPLFVIFLYVLYKSKSRNESLLWIMLAASSHILTYITFVNDTYLYLPLICVIIAGNFYFLNNLPKLTKEWKTVIFSICFVLMLMKTLSASQMWRSDKDLWQYSYLNEGSPYSSILLGVYLLKYDEKVALEFIEWGAKNYDIIGNRAVFIFFLETIYESSLPIQKKIQILNDCYKDHRLYKAYYALVLLRGTSLQVDKGVNLLKPYLNDVEIDQKFWRDRWQIITTEVKKMCLEGTDKDRICKQLGFVY